MRSLDDLGHISDGNDVRFVLLFGLQQGFTLLQASLGKCGHLLSLDDLGHISDGNDVRFVLQEALAGDFVNIQGVIAAVEAHGQRQHDCRDRNGHHDARQHQAGWDGVDVGFHVLDAVFHDGGAAAFDVALGSQEEEDGAVHDGKADDLLDHVAVQQQRGETDAEKHHGRHFHIVVKDGHLTYPPF